MPTPATESNPSMTRWPFREARTPGLVAMVLLLLAGGCRHSDRGTSADQKGATGKSEEGKTAGIQVVKPEKRDIRMMVVQPGTLQAFEESPIYSRISGYVQKYRYNIGDRVKVGDILLDMWIPDLVAQLAQKTAMVSRSEVQIDVTQSALRAAEAKLETAKARILSAEAGVKRRRPATRAGSRNTSGSSCSSPSASSTSRSATRPIASSRRPSRRATRRMRWSPR